MIRPVSAFVGPRAAFLAWLRSWIDRVTRGEWKDRQVDLLDLIAEEGDPDGCSPYGCRSGEQVAP